MKKELTREEIILEIEKMVEILNDLSKYAANEQTRANTGAYRATAVSDVILSCIQAYANKLLEIIG